MLFGQHEILDIASKQAKGWQVKKADGTQGSAYFSRIFGLRAYSFPCLSVAPPNYLEFLEPDTYPHKAKLSAIVSYLLIPAVFPVLTLICRFWLLPTTQTKYHLESMKYLTSLTNKGNGGKQRRQMEHKGVCTFLYSVVAYLQPPICQLYRQIIFSKFWNQITISTKQKLLFSCESSTTRVSVFPVLTVIYRYRFC